MFRMLSSLIPASKSSRRKQSVQVKPRVEGLEDRCLLSAYSLLSNQIYGVAQYSHIVFVNYVPNLQGVDFHLVSSNGKPPHDLTIQSETWNADGSATITGTWAGGSSHAFSGTLSYDAQGNLKISVSWSNGMNGTNTLNGTITRNYSPYIFGSQWHLDGDVSSSTGGGPGHVSGNSLSPFTYIAQAMLYP
jgi:hypothetical protein